MSNNNWPLLNYRDFASTAYLLHMTTQMMGKLKLQLPFEPQWAHVILFVTTNGLTTGMLPYKDGYFSIHLNLLQHEIMWVTTQGIKKNIPLHSMSVAAMYQQFLEHFHWLGIHPLINTKPQEISDPILFPEDKEERNYNPELAQSWWHILLKSTEVMQIYRAKFLGKTPPLGFMWGTFDLRDLRTNGQQVEVPKEMGYIRRNAMDVAQIEAGFWHGNPVYQQPAYYSFTYPQPESIEKAQIQPRQAHWHDSLKLFILDYEAVRQSPTPEQDLLQFFESTYAVGSNLANWDKALVGSGKPVI